MPRPLPVPLRQAIWRRYQDGQDGPTIAEALGLAPRTVRNLLDRFRRGGPDALYPSYDRVERRHPSPPNPWCKPPWACGGNIRPGEPD